MEAAEQAWRARRVLRELEETYLDAVISLGEFVAQQIALCPSS